MYVLIRSAVNTICGCTPCSLYTTGQVSQRHMCICIKCVSKYITKILDGWRSFHFHIKTQFLPHREHISTRKTDHIVLFRKIIAVYYKNHAQHIIYSQMQNFSLLQTGINKYSGWFFFNPLSPELNPVCYLLALLAHDFLHVSRIRVKSLTLTLLMSYIHGAPILDVSRSHTTTQHSR
jgi:hypothetical protein